MDAGLVAGGAAEASAGLSAATDLIPVADTAIVNSNDAIPLPAHRNRLK
jgi:hypothetical protein